MPLVTLKSSTYHQLLEQSTSEAERAFYPSRAIELPGGRVQLALPDLIMQMMREFMLPGEDFDRFDDVIERLLALHGRRVH
jgi:hypothetical protein